MLTRILIVSTGIACIASGQQSLDVGATTRLSFSIPSQPPYTSLARWSFETRIHGVNAAAAQGIFSGVASASLTFDGNGNVRIIDWSSAGASASLAARGRTDMIVRVQRNYDQAGHGSLELMDADGANCRYVVFDSDTKPLDSSSRSSGDGYVGSTWGGTKLTGSIAYFRWSSSTVTNLCSDKPGNVPRGDLADMEFEGDTSLRSGLVSISFTGTPAYRPTPFFALADPERAIVRAGTPVAVDATGSGGTAYTWEQVSGPTIAAISNPLSGKVTIRGLVRHGEYRFSVTERDGNGQAAAKNITIGVTAATSSGRVLHVDRIRATLLGPQLMEGVSPWPKFDEYRITRGDALYPTVITLPGSGKAQSGTLNLTANSKRVTGVQTDFGATFCASGATYPCTPPSDRSMLITYFAGGAGWNYDAVVSVESPTTLNMYYAWGHPTETGVAFAYDSIAQETQWKNNNYYDSVEVNYAQYYRTGETKWLERARTQADLWFTFIAGNGYFDCNTSTKGCPAPRDASLAGLMLRAVDGKPEYWPWIRSYFRFTWNVWVGRHIGKITRTWYTREEAYCLLYAAMIAAADPDVNGAAWARSEMERSIEGFYLRTQCNPDGRTDCPAGWDGAFIGPDASAAYWTEEAEQPFHVGLLNEALLTAYHVSTSETLKARILQMLTLAEQDLQKHGYGMEACPTSSGFNTGTFRRAPYYIVGPKAHWISGGANDDCSSPACWVGCGTPSTFDQVRVANNTVVYVWGGLFEITRNAAYKARGDDSFAALFGFGQGPGSDAYGGLAWQADVKQYGQTWRSTGKYLGSVFGSDAPVGVSTRVSFSLPPGANAARLLYTATNGSRTAPVTCTSSPCTVSLDLQPGVYERTLELLNATGDVLSSDTRAVAISR